MSESEENEAESENSDNEDNNKQTEIEASLASLDVTVRTEGKENCEDLFYNVWEYITDDAEEMTESMRDRLSGP